MSNAYAMVIEPQKTKRGQHYCASFPDLPGCATMARSLPELRKHGGGGRPVPVGLGAGSSPFLRHRRKWTSSAPRNRPPGSA